MRCSIIVPVYNVAEYLEKCVASILANDCSDCEILLIDDGSTDGRSGELCDTLAAQSPELIRVIHQKNGGLGAARNTGIEQAKGEYLAFIDSDDLIVPDYLSSALTLLEQTKADICTFDFFCKYPSKTEVFAASAGLPETPFTLREQPTLLLAMPNAWSRVWRRSLFTDSGIRYPGRVWYEDIRTSGKLFAEASSIVALHKPLYYYVIRENSITHNKNVTRNREILEAFEDLLGWYREHGLFDVYRDELCRLCVDHVLVAATVRVLRSDRKHPLIGELREFTERNFPDYRNNPYLSTLRRAKKLAYRLSAGKHYGLLALLFAAKERLQGD